MSQKFKDRLLTGSGVSKKKFTSDYGAKLLEQMGWKDGQGLGKNKNGISECIQIKRREENQGIGKENVTERKWNDQWWENNYNDAIKGIKNTDSNSDESSTSSEEEAPRLRTQKVLLQQKKIQKQNKK